MALLLVSCSVVVVIPVFDLFTLGEIALGEQLLQFDSGRFRLAGGVLLLLLGLSLLLLFGCSGCNIGVSLASIILCVVVGIVSVVAVGIVNGLCFSVGLSNCNLLETVILTLPSQCRLFIVNCHLLLSSSRAFSGTCAAISNNKFWWMQLSRG